MRAADCLKEVLRLIDFCKNCILFSAKENSRKLIAGALSADRAVIDRLHHGIRRDQAKIPAVADHHGCVAEFG